MQNPPDAGQTHRYHLRIQHHEGQAPIAIQRIAVVKLHIGLLLLGFQTEVARNPAAVFVHPAIAACP
jgi:hypothetical protein